MKTRVRHGSLRVTTRKVTLSAGYIRGRGERRSTLSPSSPFLALPNLVLERPTTLPLSSRDRTILHAQCHSHLSVSFSLTHSRHGGRLHRLRRDRHPANPGDITNRIRYPTPTARTTPSARSWHRRGQQHRGGGHVPYLPVFNHLRRVVRPSRRASEAPSECPQLTVSR